MNKTKKWLDAPLAEIPMHDQEAGAPGRHHHAP